MFTVFKVASYTDDGTDGFQSLFAGTFLMTYSKEVVNPDFT